MKLKEQTYTSSWFQIGQSAAETLSWEGQIVSLWSTNRSEGNLGAVPVVHVVDFNCVKGRDGENLRAVPVTIVVEDRTTGLCA